MNFGWYPGHMTKARRRMEENLKLVDLVIELTDARTPDAGRNPDIGKLSRDKAKLLILTKPDLADEEVNKEWADYYREQGLLCVLADVRNTKAVRQIRPKITEACQDVIARRARRGIIGRPVRAMVVGIPNVGKSTFINALAGRSSARTGNKPGVTKGEQWIRPDKTLELLDTPGILWPKFEDQEAALRLALTGTIRDELLDSTQLAVSLYDCLRERYPDAIARRYSIEPQRETLLEQVARSRSLLASGGVPDIERAGSMVIDDFRSGKLGRISLECPAQQHQ